MTTPSQGARTLRPRRAHRAIAAILLTASLGTATAACGDDDADLDDMDDIDVDITSDTGTDMTGTGGAGSTPSGGSTDLTTGGTATGDSATIPTPVSGSVSNDDGGGG